MVMGGRNGDGEEEWWWEGGMVMERGMAMRRRNGDGKGSGIREEGFY
jgi:hypothetical protein